MSGRNTWRGKMVAIRGSMMTSYSISASFTRRSRDHINQVHEQNPVLVTLLCSYRAIHYRQIRERGENFYQKEFE